MTISSPGVAFIRFLSRYAKARGLRSDFSSARSGPNLFGFFPCYQGVLLFAMTRIPGSGCGDSETVLNPADRCCKAGLPACVTRANRVWAYAPGFQQSVGSSRCFGGGDRCRDVGTFALVVPRASKC